MTSNVDTLHWTFAVPTPLGDTHSTYEIGDDALHYESDDLFAGGSETVRWDSIGEGGTATMAGMGGRGGPDLPNWVPAQMEWLTLSRSAGGGAAVAVLVKVREHDERPLRAVGSLLGSPKEKAPGFSQGKSGA